MLPDLQENAQLALDTINHKPTKGIPTWLMHPMERRFIDRLAGMPEGSYEKNPHSVYLKMQHECNTCMIDQFIPDNAMSMGNQGYEEDRQRTATTDVKQIVLNDMLIDSPEAAVEHMEKFMFPDIRKSIEECDEAWEDARVAEIVAAQRHEQGLFGPNILKTGYGFIRFPNLYYSTYGYANYFMAYGLYPEVIEEGFSLQADLALINNRAAAQAYKEGNLPNLYRLDHDIADSRGTLMDVKSLDKMWFPHFARCLEPMLNTDVQMIWHCDGNLMEMVPRLLEVGIRGFQGFQYEDGMDYEAICKMKSKDGEPLFIIAGVSVTTTLPMGTPDDVKKEMKWLVENGPKTGLMLGQSSSITPGVPWENLKTFAEGRDYYRINGREG